ncbi:MAG: protein kinase domain-containing protein [Myxococcaceae bacterium]
MLEPNSLVLGERFRVLGHLGGGGMGEVYLAEQVSLGRRVALKVLRREVGQQPGMSERFRREARLLSSVEHPAVVRVIDFGTSQDATCLVMEFAEGETLLQTLGSGSLTPERGRRVMLQLAEGLAAIHSKDIIHRDLKPENVVLTPGPRGEQARLLDFGIAKLLQPDPDAKGLSAVGVVLGTPEYLSPEQAMGHPLDARSDIYSLGVLSYRMLSGVLPFNGPNARDYLVQHIGTPPTPLVEVAPAMAEDPDLGAIVMRCLAKDPRVRFQTAEDLVRALESPPKAAGRMGPLLPRAISSVSEVIFARRPTASAVPVPEGPLLELPTGSITPVPPPERVADTLSSVFGRRRWRTPALVGVGALVLFAGGLAFRGGRSGLDEAGTQLDGGKAREALATLDGLEKSGTPASELAGLRAAALHALRDHAAELKVLLGARGASSVIDRRTLSGVAEDLEREGGEGPRKDFLDGLDAGRSAAVLRAIAESGTTEAAWGALHYLERQHRTETLDLMALYGSWLDGTDCAARIVAARRLGELGRPEAVAALQKAKKKRLRPGCGQDEVVAALRALERN